LELAVSAGLVVEDERRQLRPQLAEAVPSIENGLWRLLTDRRMETSLRLREGVRWHDRTPLTAEDLVFSAKVAQDKELPDFGNLALNSVESVEAADPRTITVRWKTPYIEADTLFSTAVAVALPRHLLEKSYLEDKAGFTQTSFWTTEFVGSGPYKLREWQTASYAILEAFGGEQPRGQRGRAERGDRGRL
jgi:peptide/nickel transport system substrate-binding protein